MEATGRTGSASSWRAREGVARTISIAAQLLPTVLAVLVAVVISQVLPTPHATAEVVAWWIAVLGSPFLTVLATERLTRQVLPLAYLFRLTLVFPDHTPTRYRVAREANRMRALRQDLLDPHVGTGPATAEQVIGLVAALEGHDRFTRGHSGRVLLFVDLLAEELEIPLEDRHRLRWAALLHDIGKLEVDHDVLNKPGRPDPHEWEMLRAHPSVGERLAAPIAGWLGPWMGAIVEHHERWDGQGYPAGLSGTDISLGGRIAAVADVYETLTAGRPYREPMGAEAAREELVRVAGTQLDPTVVRAFLDVSVGRLRPLVKSTSLLATVPALAFLQAIPARARDGAIATGTVVAMAVGGLVGIEPAPPAAPPVAAPAPGPGSAEAPSSPPGPPDPAVAPPDPGPPDGPPAAEGEPGVVPVGDRPPGGPDAPPDGEPESPSASPRRVGTETTTASTALYLGAPERPVRHARLPLEARRPTRATASWDDRDDRAGLGLRPSESQRWTSAAPAPTTPLVPVELVVWVAGSPSGSEATLSVTVEACSAGERSCREVATARRTASVDASFRRLHVTLDPQLQLESATVLRLTITNAGTATAHLGFGSAELPAELLFPSARPTLLADGPAPPQSRLGDLPPLVCTASGRAPEAARPEGCAQLP